MLAGAVVATIGGCADLPEIAYEGTKVRIGTYFDEPLCAGDIAHLDEFVSTIENDLAVSSSERIDVYLYRGTEPPGGMPWPCNPDAPGCFNPDENYVVATMEGAEHELVHAVADRIGPPPSTLLREGAADALADRRTVFGSTLPTENIATRFEDTDHATAGHFMRWLWVEHGPDPFRKIMRMRMSFGDPRERFSEAYGFSIEEAEADYLGTAPWSYAARWPCESPPLMAVGDDVWHELAEFDCATEEVLAGIFLDRPSIHVRRTFDVANGGLYTITVRGSSFVRLRACQLESIATKPSNVNDDGPWTFEGGFVNAVELAPQRYEVDLVSSASGPASVEVAIRPALAGLPDGPG